MTTRTAALTLVALVAFAANSILCRLALGSASIDAASFTTVRIAAGALTLWLVCTASASRRAPPLASGSWWTALMLFAYAIAFSFAYLSLAAGTGALILFGAVQATMIVAGIAAGERPRARQWLGLVLALAGLAYLVSPGLAAPAPLGALLMGAAGVAWGLYSISGRRVVDPIAATASNFIRALPFALVLSLATGPARLSPRGFVLAAVSGAIASGLGYVIWYAALPRLTSTQAAVVQLAVPPLAALAAVAFLGEALTLRLVLCSGLILGGIAIAVTSRH